MLTEAYFNDLYEQKAAKILNWLVANGADYGTACDIVQQSFLRLWEHRASFDDGQVPQTWLFATARHLRVDIWRQLRRQVLYEDMGSVKTAEGQSPAAAEAEGDDTLLRKRLVEALGCLPELLRLTYTLYQVGGNSILEVAALTGATENLVKVRLHRARQRLRKLLSDL